MCTLLPVFLRTLNYKADEQHSHTHTCTRTHRVRGKGRAKAADCVEFDSTEVLGPCGSRMSLVLFVHLCWWIEGERLELRVTWIHPGNPEVIQGQLIGEELVFF